jgi:enterobacterial common antigen flippase
MGSDSHAKILKSTSIIGGAAALGVVIRVIRSKGLALLLGPAGVGVEVLYNSIVQLSQTISSLGVNSSGVRQIAAAVGSNERHLLNRTVWILRRTSIVLGALGALLLFLFRKPICILTFGSDARAGAVGVLSVTVLFGAISAGQTALLQGLRRIGDLARVQVLGASAGTLFSIPIVWMWGVQGIPAYLVIVSGFNLLVSWGYARKTSIDRVTVPLKDVRPEVAKLLGLGIALLSSSFMSLAALYALRVIVSRRLGMDAVGHFQAASTLSIVYASFVFQAMGADFYPRLSSVVADDAECNKLVNEQTEVSLLLTIPGIVGTIAMAPLIIHVFYSPKFAPAAEILVWQGAGVLLQVSSNAMAFVLVAKGRAATHFVSEAIAWSAYVFFALLGLKWFGLPGLGLGFLAMYALFWFMVYLLVHRLTGFRWSSRNVRLNILGIVLVTLTLAAHFSLPGWGAFLVGAFLLFFASFYCLSRLLRLVGSEKVNQCFKKLKIPFGIPRWLSRYCGDLALW